MGNIDQQLVLEAKANLKKTWEDLFNLTDIQDKDKELLDELEDSCHPVTTLLLYICQIQSFILPEINRAIITQDQTKVNTLGPFN